MLLANYDAMDLIACIPHVWAARWEEWNGWTEYSHAATNENGEPTHWAEMPASDPEAVGKTLGELGRALSEDEVIASIKDKQ